MQKVEECLNVLIAHYASDFQSLRAEGGEWKCERWEAEGSLSIPINIYVFDFQLPRLEGRKEEVRNAHCGKTSPVRK